MTTLRAAVPQETASRLGIAQGVLDAVADGLNTPCYTGD